MYLGTGATRGGDAVGRRESRRHSGWAAASWAPLPAPRPAGDCVLRGGAGQLTRRVARRDLGLEKVLRSHTRNQRGAQEEPGGQGVGHSMASVSLRLPAQQSVHSSTQKLLLWRVALTLGFVHRVPSQALGPVPRRKTSAGSAPSEVVSNSLPRPGLEVLDVL